MGLLKKKSCLFFVGSVYWFFLICLKSFSQDLPDSGVPSAVPQIAGTYSDLSKLEFAGNTFYSRESIITALQSSDASLSDFHWFTSFSAFLENLEKMITQGYLASGFYDVKIKVFWNENTKRVGVKITEGQQYTFGKICVSGLKEINAAEFIQTLNTAYWDPKGGQSKSYWMNEVRRESTPSNPLWKTGNPYEYSREEFALLKNRVSELLLEYDCCCPVFKVKQDFRSDTHAVDLLVNIIEENYKPEIHQIILSGNKKNSSKDIFRLMHFNQGMVFSGKGFKKALKELWESARFLDIEFSFSKVEKEKNSADLTLILKESKKAPSLAKQMSKYQEILLFIRGKLLDLQYKNNGLEFKAWFKENSFLGNMNLTGNLSQKGLLADFSFVDLLDREFRFIFLCEDGNISLYSFHNKKKLENIFRDKQLKAFFSITPTFEKDKEHQLQFGGNVSGKKEAEDVTVNLDLSLCPTGFITMPKDKSSTLSENSGITTIQGKFLDIVYDSNKQNFEKFIIKPDQNKRVDIIFNKNSFLETSENIREISENFEEWSPDIHSPLLKSFLFIFNAFCDVYEGNQNLKDKLKIPYIFIIRKNMNDLIQKGFLNFPEMKKNKKEPGFEIPEITPKKTFLLPILSLKEINTLILDLPIDSWPSLAIKQELCILNGNGLYTGRLLKYLLNPENKMGPLGYSIISETFAKNNQQLRYLFAEEGLKHLDKSDFQKDYQIFIRENSLCSRILIFFLRFIQNLDESSFYSFFKTASKNKINLVEPLWNDLRKNQDTPVLKLLADHLDLCWENYLKEKLKTGFQKVSVSASKLMKNQNDL